MSNLLALLIIRALDRLAPNFEGTGKAFLIMYDEIIN